MVEFQIAGLLTWAMAFTWWGMDLALRGGVRQKVVGGLLILLAILPSAVALWIWSRA